MYLHFFVVNDTKAFFFRLSFLNIFSLKSVRNAPVPYAFRPAASAARSCSASSANNRIHRDDMCGILRLNDHYRYLSFRPISRKPCLDRASATMGGWLVVARITDIRECCWAGTFWPEPVKWVCLRLRFRLQLHFFSPSYQQNFKFL